MSARRVARLAGVAMAMVAVLTSGTLAAQSVRSADSLLRLGAIDRAEAAYYAASRAHPRDPQSRFALGRFLAARGAFRIGATLIDEAMQFGYDRALGNEALAPVYATIGDFAALAKLNPSPLSGGARAQAQWLADHPSRVTAPDSSVLVALARTGVEGFVGSTRLRINGRPIVALIEPRSGCGIRIADTTLAAQSLHRFASANGDGRSIPGAADSIGLGRMSITNVPVTIEQLRAGAPAVVCFGFLARYAPTFDVRAALMTLHLALAPSPRATATLFPVLEVGGAWSIPQAGGWLPLSAARAADVLRDRRWTFDARRGQIELEP